jgi:hypothetical protein
MLKYRANSPGINNVVLGGDATLDLDPGYRYHKVNVIVTVTKTGATAGAAFQPLLADALGMIQIFVNTKCRRQHLATELNAIQTRWHNKLAVAQLDQVANDCITAVADVVNGANTTRTTTFILPICFAEPSRDSYTARDSFAWPTLWASGRVAKIQVKLSVPANVGVANPVMRATHIYDNVLGPVVSGNDAMPITHWYRDTETYSGTAVPVQKWPFQAGALQQVTVFCPANDDVATFQVKGDRDVIAEGTKADSDNDCNNYEWNNAAVNADRFDLAFDFDDDPMNAVVPSRYGTFRLNLTLTQAVAANKNLILIEQVYQDAFAAS